MTTAVLLGVAIYAGGCVPAFVFFLVGHAPALFGRNWPWLVIFVWPLLPFWPLRHGFRRLPRARHRRQKLVLDHPSAAAPH